MICSDCGTVISNTTIPKVGCEYETQNLAEAAKIWETDITQINLAKYLTWTDWNVKVCKYCNYVDEETITSMYTAQEEAEIMMGYVNKLRKEVLGSQYQELVIDQTLLELAQIRAKELSIVFAHSGTYTNASENATNAGCTIINHYDAWLNSTNHYNAMISKDKKYFAYARYRVDGVVYGVQLFWSTGDRSEYEQSKHLYD